MITHELHKIQDERAPFEFMSFILFHGKSNSSRPGNWHEDLELLCINDGDILVYIGEDTFTASAGDVVIFNPNVIHSMIPASHSVSFDCLIVNSEFCLNNHIDIDNLQFKSFIRDDKLLRLIQELKNEFPRIHPSPFTLNDEDRDLKYLLPQRAMVLRIIAYLYCNHQDSKHIVLSPKSVSNKVKQALEYIHSNIDRDISLDEVAAEVGLNSCYFSKEFRKATQYTFVSYVNFVRCERAKYLLRKKQDSIAEISKKCGFSNQSYFSKTFLRLEGRTPSEYQKRKEDENPKAANAD